jgi:hypothetical protein
LIEIAPPGQLRRSAACRPDNIDGLVAAEIDVESLEEKRLRVAQVAWFSSRRLMNGACLVGTIASAFL